MRLGALFSASAKQTARRASAIDAHRQPPLDFVAHNVLGVMPDAEEAPRPPGPKPWQAEHIGARDTGDAAPVHRIARPVEDGQVGVGPVRGEAGRPETALHARRAEVEVGRLAAGCQTGT